MNFLLPGVGLLCTAAVCAMTTLHFLKADDPNEPSTEAGTHFAMSEASVELVS